MASTHPTNALQKQNLFLYPKTLVRINFKQVLYICLSLSCLPADLHNKFKTSLETEQVLSYEWAFYSCHRLVSRGLGPSSSADSQVPPCYPWLVPGLAPSFHFHPYLDPGCIILPEKTILTSEWWWWIPTFNQQLHQVPTERYNKKPESRQLGTFKSPWASQHRSEKLNKRFNLQG